MCSLHDCFAILPNELTIEAEVQIVGGLQATVIDESAAVERGKVLFNLQAFFVPFNVL